MPKVCGSCLPADPPHSLTPTRTTYRKVTSLLQALPSYLLLSVVLTSTAGKHASNPGQAY